MTTTTDNGEIVKGKKIIEGGPGVRAGLAAFAENMNIHTISAAIVAAIFGCTGPALLVMKAAADGGLTNEQAISWIFGIYVFGGLLGVFLALRYKMPINGAYSIPAAVLLIESLKSFSFEQACGAYIVSGLIVLVLGLSGLIGKAMRLLPLPIVQAMIVGCMIRFGVGIIHNTEAVPVMGVAALIGFFLAPKISKRIPGVLAALVCGLAVAMAQGVFAFDFSQLVWSGPHLYAPTFDLNAILSIGIPIAVLVIGAENAQAIGVLYCQGYRPPVNAMTIFSGLGGILAGLVGAHNANVAGPMTAICSGEEAGEKKEGRYVASALNGLLFAVFGLLGPVAIIFVAGMPKSLVGIVAGLAMINVLIGALRDGFASNKFRFGAFAALIIGMSGLTMLKVSSPLWALVGGVIVSLLMEPDDFKQGPTEIECDCDSNLPDPTGEARLCEETS